MRSRARFSRAISLRAHVEWTTSPASSRRTSSVMRSSSGPPAVHDRVDDGGQVLGLGLGKEAHVTEVDPEQRHPARPGTFGRAEHRAVAARARRRRRCRRRRSRPTAPPRCPDRGRCRRTPPGRSRSSSARTTSTSAAASRRTTVARTDRASSLRGFTTSRTRRVASSVGHCGPSVTARRDRPLQRLPDERGGVVPHPAACTAQPEEVLDVTARAGQRARRDTEDREPQPDGRLGHTLHSGSSERGVAHHAVAHGGAPHLELRLDHEHEVGVVRRRRRQGRAGPVPAG